MDEKQSGSCLAEIPGIEDKETPSGRSTRASLAKLPKIGVFSSSSKSVDAEVPQSDGDQLQTKLTSKPPSRQGTEKASTLTTKQLEIHINLSDVLDSKQAATPKREQTPLKREKTPMRQMTPMREEREETRIGSKSNKLTAMPSQIDPPIWVWSSVKKGKGERPRTKTWPALQYKLWLDSSNLPLHLLCNDERANRPQHLLLPQTVRKSAKSSRLSSNMNDSFKLTNMSTDHGKSNRDWSVKFLSVSRPSFRPDKKNSDNGILSHKAKEERKRAEVEAVSGLHVGVGESWQVATSFAHRPESRQRQNQKLMTRRLRSIDGANLPQVGKGTYPRIPSRMGQNNLEAFLKQNTTFGDMSHSHSGESIPGLSKLPTAVISPRHFCNTSAEVSLLTLRSYARNPRMLQELTERNEDFNPAALAHQNEFIRSVELERDGVRHVRFKVPCGSSEEEEMKVTLARSKNSGGMGNRILSDVTPPQTPPNFDRTFRISVLPTFCKQ